MGPMGQESARTAIEANEIVGVGAGLPLGGAAQRIAVQAHLALRVVASLGLVAERLVDLDVTRDAIGDDRHEGVLEALSVGAAPIRGIPVGAIPREANTNVGHLLKVSVGNAIANAQHEEVEPRFMGAGRRLDREVLRGVRLVVGIGAGVGFAVGGEHDDRRSLGARRAALNAGNEGVDALSRWGIPIARPRVCHWVFGVDRAGVVEREVDLRRQLWAWRLSVVRRVCRQAEPHDRLEARHRAGHCGMGILPTVAPHRAALVDEEHDVRDAARGRNRHGLAVVAAPGIPGAAGAASAEHHHASAPNIALLGRTAAFGGRALCAAHAIVAERPELTLGVATA